MSTFVDFTLETLQAWRAVTARRMFGGHGLFHRGLMLALVFEGRLFLKVDNESRPVFEAQGLAPFLYASRGRTVRLSYHEAPQALFDDPTLAVQWAEMAWQAALRAHLQKKARQEALPKPASSRRARQG